MLVAVVVIVAVVIVTVVIIVLIRILAVVRIWVILGIKLAATSKAVIGIRVRMMIVIWIIWHETTLLFVWLQDRIFKNGQGVQDIYHYIEKLCAYFTLLNVFLNRTVIFSLFFHIDKTADQQWLSG